MDKPRLYCGSFKAQHCSSCHTDADEYGYDLSELDGADFSIELCCTFPSPKEDETQEQYEARLKEQGIEKESAQ